MTNGLRHAQGDGLAWLAFLYVAGDLDPDAEAAFEQRLGTDQAAREALADAVGLVEAVDLAARPLRRPSGSVLSSRRGTLALAGAGLAAAAGLAAVLALPAGHEPAAPPAEASAESVALAWSGLRLDAGAEAPPHEALIAWLDAATEPTPLPPAADPADEAPPAWLLEAARLRDALAPDGQGS